jgi:hypothetical protein
VSSYLVKIPLAQRWRLQRHDDMGFLPVIRGARIAWNAGQVPVASAAFSRDAAHFSVASRAGYCARPQLVRPYRDEVQTTERLAAIKAGAS